MLDLLRAIRGVRIVSAGIIRGREASWDDYNAKVDGEAPGEEKKADKQQSFPRGSVVAPPKTKRSSNQKNQNANERAHAKRRRSNRLRNKGQNKAEVVEVPQKSIDVKVEDNGNADPPSMSEEEDEDEGEEDAAKPVLLIPRPLSRAPHTLQC